MPDDSDVDLELVETEASLSLQRQLLVNLFARYSSILNKVKGYGKTKLLLIKSKLDLAISLRKELQIIEKDILILNAKLPAKSKSILDISKQVDQIDDIIEAIDVIYSEAIDSNKSNSTIFEQPRSNTHDHVPSAFRLPTIEINKFTGNIKEYQSFMQLFNAIYDSHPHLKKSEKLFYLQSLLKGEPLSLVTTFPLTDDGYDNALLALENRYNCPRTLAATLITAILDFEPAKRATAESLKQFITVHQDYVNVLKSIQSIPDLTDFLLLSISTRNLDNYTRRLFENHVTDGQIPTCENLINFLQKQITTLELLSVEKSTANENTTQNYKYTTANKQPQNRSYEYSKSLHVSSSLPQDKKHSAKRQFTKYVPYCIYCKETHTLGKCSRFLSLSTNQRLDWAKAAKRCTACLRDNHFLADCKSDKCCMYCSSKSHHSLLCETFTHSPSYFQQNKTQPNQPPTCTENTLDSKVMTCNFECNNQCNNLGGSSDNLQNSVLLGTLQVRIHDCKGDIVICRSMLDTGSVQNLITRKTADRLGLRVKPDKITLSGVNDSLTETLGTVQLTIKSLYNDSKINITAYVLDHITSDLHPVSLDNQQLKVLSSYSLADSELLNEKPRPIHILLGISSTLDLLQLTQQSENLIQSTAIPDLRLLNTSFGKIICGKNISNSSTDSPHSALIASVTTIDHNNCNNCSAVANDIKKFFENENLNIEGNNEINVSNEDQFVENHFVSTHLRGNNGQFIVRLPAIYDNFSELGNNRKKALACFYSLESRLMKSEPDFLCYKNALQEFFDLGQISTTEKCNDYILNQHVVTKRSSGKAKIVFNPAIRSNSKTPSFNETLYSGPKLQRDLNYVLISARANPVAMSFDIDRFYRSIDLNPEDADKLHIFARLDTDGKVSASGNVKEVRLNHLIYGLTCSPWLSLRCLKQLALENETSYNLGSLNILQNRYIDDFFFSAPTVSDCIKIKNETIAILAQGNFTVSKFLSSHDEAIADVATSDQLLPLSSTETTPVLGAHWTPRQGDFFSFQIKPYSGDITKRLCTSYLARCYDPLGLLAPALFYMKTFIQQLYHDPNITWDTKLPVALQSKWLQFVEEMPLLSEIKIPRYCSLPNAKQYLCVFSDASTLGYASAAYIVSKGTNQITSHLIISKNRLAPMRTIRTVAQLELSAIELSSSLIKWFLDGNLPYNVEKIFVYSDSMIALSYLHIPAHKLKTFTANRVSNIRRITQATKIPIQWLFCNSAYNSADFSTRGQTPRQMLQNKMWFQCPQILKEFPPDGNLNINEIPAACLPEVKHKILIAKADPNPNTIFQLTEHYSNYSRLQRVTAYILRFVKNCKISKPNRICGPITAKELNNSTLLLVKIVQDHFFNDLKTKLINEKQCPKNLISLSPFIDNFNLIRVGGRLQNLKAPFESKHPLLLPNKCNFSTILSKNFHILALHAGSNLSTALLRNHFWVISGKKLMKSLIHKCVTCTKYTTKTALNPIQGNLPKYRLESTFCFRGTVGCDCFGPYPCKLTQRKNSAICKVWGLIFVCENTRAVHIETLSSLSCKDFLAAIDRFTARRSIPLQFRADCGTNFKAGFRKMSEFSEFLKNNKETILSHISTSSIKFNHIPPYTPWMSSWETLIKSAKRLLKPILTAPLFFEEYTTVFAKVEMLLNSKPYLEPNNDPKDNTQLLCPGNLLVGGPFTAPPTLLPYDCNEQTSISTRWDRLNNNIRLFWKRWSSEVLHTLMQKYKWPKNSSNIKINDLVWVKDACTVPAQWPLAFVIRTFPDINGDIRVVELKTADGSIIRRAVRNLIIVPNNN